MSKYGVISGPYFPVFVLSAGKYGPEINPYLDIFHAVTECKKLLGIKVDCRLKFVNYLNGVFEKASNKIKMLCLQPHHLRICQKKKMLMNSFFKSQFNYCLWMFEFGCVIVVR